MKVLRAHDYKTQPEFRPNVRALRGILAALAASAFFCICVAIALLPGLRHAPHAVRRRFVAPRPAHAGLTSLFLPAKASPHQ
jgi:hypothetical protein